MQMPVIGRICQLQSSEISFSPCANTLNRSLVQAGPWLTERMEITAQVNNINVSQDRLRVHSLESGIVEQLVEDVIHTEDT